MRVYFVVHGARWYPDVLDRIKCPATTIRSVVLRPPRRRSSKFGVIAGLALHELRDVFRLLPLALRNDGETVFVCATSHYSALLSARIASALGRPSAVFLFNFYLHEMGERAVVRRALKSLMRGRVGIVVQSPSEVDYFLRLAPHAFVAHESWGMGPIAALSDAVDEGDYVFSGGYSNRDYHLVVAAAAALPQVPFVLACRTASRLPPDLPPNIRVVRDAPWDAFHHLLAAARLVVLPLKRDVGSSGQMVALAAMQAGKCTIYSDVSVVGQYFENGQTGIACPIGNAARMAELIDHWYQNRIGAECIGQAAKSAAATFSADAFESAVARHASAFIARETGEHDGARP